MRSKFAAVIGACLLLIGIASAQEYSIRANRYLNLRAAPSLDAAIADTVPASAVLRVLGRSGSWLQISGDAGEVWLADWVDYSHVDRLEQTGSQPQPAQIDNCCFVDRQCHSDQEWTQGYWAYQNNQCPAPTQKPAQPSSQPAAAVSSQVDNCCFVDRQCHTDQEWAAGYWAYQNGQCSAAPARASAIRPSRPLMEGSDRFVRHVGLVLDWMEREAPEWYNFAISGLSVIVEVPIPDQDMTHTCTALAYKNERKATLESCWVNKFQLYGYGLSAKYDRFSTATAIVHEACHIHIGDAGLVYESAYEERLCRERGAGVEVALDPHQRLWNLKWDGEPSLNVVRRWCAQGYHPELYCPTIQRLRGG